MTISSEDISVVLSGGETNTNPNNALGGVSSSTPIIDGSLNNLFNDISPEQSESGYEDYRCIYFCNDGEDSIYEINVWIDEDYPGGAVMEIGTEQQNETQRVTLTNGPIIGGSMLLSFQLTEQDTVSFTSTYHSDLNIWSANLQSSLRGLNHPTTGESLFTDVEVSAQYSGSGSSAIIFDILFIGQDGYTDHPNISVSSESFSPSQVEVATSVPFEGSPINKLAAEIDVETTPPGNVGFFAASEASPISLPVLKPLDEFSLWIKRTITADSTPQQNDGFKLRLSAQTLEAS